MSEEWEEIRRLAADFQKAQFADTAQRLSERNCIEIITMLVKDKRLNVVHTLDGKEYITTAQIEREIRDELYVHGGRINLAQLQQVINVDWVHVESQAAEIVKTDKVQLVLGQLIDDSYMDRLAEEVNDRLQEAGLISVSDLCKIHDLPGDFLTPELAKRLGRLIQGELDQYNRGIIFTLAFVARHTARILGLFSAITRPTPISGIIAAFGFQEHLLYSVLEELVNTGRLKGTVVGGRQDKAIYVPDIYSKTQSAWIDSFLLQNGYLEFDALLRLGIPDPSNYIKKRFKSNKLLFLQSACVGQTLMDQVEASVEEAVNSSLWSDIQAILPTCMSVEDMEMLIQQAMRNANVLSSARILGGTVVVSEKFIRSQCLSLFDEAMLQKAKKDVSKPVCLITEDNNTLVPTLSECQTVSTKKRDVERKKKATEASSSVKAGGGGNAREIRIRKTKKKGRKDENSGDDKDSSQQSHATDFMSIDEIINVLQEGVPDFPEEILHELADSLVQPLAKVYQEVLRSVFVSSSSSPSGTNKKTIKEIQEDIGNLHINIKLFEKAIKFFQDDTQVLISKHILKSVCTDVTNILVNFLAADMMLSMENTGSITSDVRIKILGKLPEEIKEPLIKLHNSLNGKAVEEFLTNLEVSAEACGFMVKKGDKKKERQALFLHRQALTEQMKDTEDPALVLHLTCVLLFQTYTQCMLHAPGRCVPQIISVLAGHIPPESQQLLSTYQSLVVKQLVSKKKEESRADVSSAEPDEESSNVRMQLLCLMPQIKDLVLSPRKTSKSEG
ncbi:E3 UFM1-protein ligase 1-like [Synchiropus splendidus]|uniref:E3 UFM1-protein ligase 1-like n=1 Tax=Synchiropus splendidus TaxID=270530 RepID=UPI00237E0EAF|nr:E3 UFM1-protein ligase 1-like [Synchiropus splendidus]